MKAIVNINRIDLLKFYLAHAFPNTDTLVVDMSYNEYISDDNPESDRIDAIICTALDDDDAIYFYGTDYFLIVVMPRDRACNIVNQLSEHGVDAYACHGGELLHESR